jgi:hypothetical protein
VLAVRGGNVRSASVEVVAPPMEVVEALSDTNALGKSLEVHTPLFAMSTVPVAPAWTPPNIPLAFVVSTELVALGIVVVPFNVVDAELRPPTVYVVDAPMKLGSSVPDAFVTGTIEGFDEDENASAGATSS